MKEKPGNGLPKIQQKGGEKELFPTKETPDLVETFQKKNLYERLGLETTATFEQVSNAYKELKTHYGADSFPQIFKLIHEAAALLTDAVHRGRYNKKNSISDNQYPYIPDQEAEFYRHENRRDLRFTEKKGELTMKIVAPHEDEYYTTLINFKQHVLMKLEFSITSITQIKGEVIQLLEKGYTTEDILFTLESASREYFFNYVIGKVNLLIGENHKDVFFHMEGIETTIDSLETLGLERKEVLSLSRMALFNYMDEYIEFKIKGQEQAAIFSINNFIDKLTKIGIPIEDIKRNILEANYRLRSKESLYEALFI